MAIIGEQLTKTFPGTRALDAVDIRVDAGDVHALLGANGSGKSTLVKILTGVYQPDGGTITVSDRRLQAIASPTRANELGIAVVHQEAPLVDTLTVAECMALFRGYPTTGGRVRWRELHRRTTETLQRFGIAIDAGALAGLLSPAERALVSLAIALDRVEVGLDLLVLDEVTASLPEDQAGVYLERVAEIAGSRAAVLMVTHRLAELHGLASHVTVLRDGRVVHAAPCGDADDETLIAHMVGTGAAPSGGRAAGDRGPFADLRSARAFAEADSDRAERVVLRVEHLAGERLADVSLRLRSGEILGIAGLAASGIGELPQILAGALARRAGTVCIDGRELSADPSPREAIAAGLALLPADRLRSGGVGSLSVAENVVLPETGRYWHRRNRQRAVVDELISRLDVRPSSGKTLFGDLSGGNQQKVLLGKWLLLEPSVLVLDDPTSGVDPGARETIFDILRDAARAGVGVLLFSTEPEQLVAMCSRVLVVRDGSVAAELTGGDLTRESVTRWCYA